MQASDIRSPAAVIDLALKCLEGMPLAVEPRLEIAASIALGPDSDVPDRMFGEVRAMIPRDAGADQAGGLFHLLAQAMARSRRTRSLVAVLDRIASPQRRFQAYRAAAEELSRPRGGQYLWDEAVLLRGRGATNSTKPSHQRIASPDAETRGEVDALYERAEAIADAVPIASAAVQQLIASYARFGRVEPALRLARRVAGWGRDIDGGLRGLVSALIHASRLEDAVRLAEASDNEWAVIPVLGAKAVALGRDGPADAARDAFDETRSRAAAYWTANVRARSEINQRRLDVASQWAWAGRYDDAVAIAGDIDDDELRFYALRVVAGAMAAAGHVDAAVKFANGFRRKMQRTAYLGLVCWHLARSNDVERLRDIASTIPEMSTRDGADWRNGWLACAAGRFARAGDTTRAMAIVQDLPDKIRFYGWDQLAIDLAEAGNIAWVERAKAECHKAIPRNNRYARKWAPSFEEIGRAFSRAGLTDDATRHFQSATARALEEVEPNARLTALLRVADAWVTARQGASTS